MSRFGRFVGDTNGLVSTPALFLSKHASRRARAAVLPSNGTRSVAPSPRTSRTSAVLSLSLRERSSAIVTAFDQLTPSHRSIVIPPLGERYTPCHVLASIFVIGETAAGPLALEETLYPSPQLATHCATVEIVRFVRGADSPGPDRHSLLFEMRPRRSRGRSHRCLFMHALPS